MDYNKLADLIFADITDTVDDLEKRFPERNLPEGARVTRFAPSPTGYMHIGGLYAAMISRKLAKQSGGVFYLRIEDTDRKRELEDGVNEIINSLKKFDLGFDEGPFEGGETIYGPYKQSERKEIYQTCVKKLMQEGYAYPDFTTAEELDEIRAKQEAAKVLELVKVAPCRHALGMVGVHRRRDKFVGGVHGDLAEVFTQAL